MKNVITISNHSEEYKSWIFELKQKIRQCQIKAAIKVNTELLKLYWQMGKDINEKSLDAQWGAGFFDKLSRDLKTEFPDMTGFSVTNLKYIKRFYMFYNQSDIMRLSNNKKLGSFFFYEQNSGLLTYLKIFPCGF